MLLDIEGTTTPIEFVHKKLFPYARARVHDFLAQHAAEPAVRADVQLLAGEYAAEPPDPDLPPWKTADVLGSAEAYVYWLMDRDRKSTGLKSLQGKIWDEGYRRGDLRGRGEVYADVRPALERWQRQGKEIAIFSSGSVQAQQNLFANTTAGDLTSYLRGYYDTTTGSKRQPASYGRIAAALQRTPREVVFVSDVGAELDAARTAGMETVLCVRGQMPDAADHPIIHTFEELWP